jgi:hypothetical protein
VAIAIRKKAGDVAVRASTRSTPAMAEAFIFLPRCGFSFSLEIQVSSIHFQPLDSKELFLLAYF